MTCINWRYILTTITLLTVTLSNAHTCPVVLNDAGENDPEILLELSQSTAEVSTSRGRCGGALVSPTFVISSIACLPRTGNKIRIGDRNASRGETLNISVVHSHSSDSIVLLELETPSTRGKPIKLLQETELKSETRVRAASFNADRILKSADTEIINAETCRERLPSKRVRSFRPRREVCSIRPSICAKKIICAGSPVVRYNSSDLVLAAIANPPFAKDSPLCSKLPNTAVFTRIAPFAEWIQAKTGTLAQNVAQEPKQKKSSRFPRWAAIALGSICGFFLLAALLNIVITTLTDRREARAIEEEEEQVRQAETDVIIIDGSANAQTATQINNVSSPPPSPPKILPRSMQ